MSAAPPPPQPVDRTPTSSAPAAADTGRRGWLTWLRPLFALAVLALVLRSLPWSDTLAWTPDGAQAPAFEIAGEIRGDWRAASIEFAVADAGPGGVTPGADWPSGLASAVRDGRAAFVTRGDGAGYTWKPGMPRVFAELELAGLVPALGLILFGIACVSARWWRLLALAGCGTSYREALRLTFLGLFFNLVLPGLTGGDLVKGVLVVRQNPRRRAEALVTVVVDRVIGLAVLVGLACVVVMASGERFAELKPWVVPCFALLVLGFWVMIAAWPRRLLRVESWIDRLPQKERLRALDRALQTYARHPLEMARAVGLTLVNHLAIAGAIHALGRAYGGVLSYSDHVAVASVANTVSAVPISPSGWGVGEYLFRELYALAGDEPTIGVAVSITFRLLMMAIGLLGGVLLLFPSGRAARTSLGERESAPVA